MTRLPLIVAVVGVLTGGVQQQPTFKSGTRTVPVYATVFDEDGRLVPGLEQSDFEIYDNGKKQAVTIFDNKPIPFSAALTLDSSISMEMNLPFMQDAAVQFVIRLAPEDKTVVGFFNSKIQFSPSLTNDRDSLVSYIRNNMTRGNSTRLWDGVDAAMDQLTDALGRRVVVVLTDGDDLGASSRSNGDILERAQREDVMIYTLGIESYYHNGERWTLSRPGGAFRRLAAETGGGFFELKKSAELNSTFTRVIAELHSQYVLGFSPTAMDGKAHKLEVRLSKPGLTARARKSYVAK
ncbi:MAG TPA: VWA domain-containing protein [Vicinamibacterales bacterium]|nr:VWA domain-containing protein [Acidobacteriota bacterium]HQX82554.1 VWA domain-containing protein [Vicinamibacterales bacterium]